MARHRITPFKNHLRGRAWRSLPSIGSPSIITRAHACYRQLCLLLRALVIEAQTYFSAAPRK
jgi:hypothetical protein